MPRLPSFFQRYRDRGLLLILVALALVLRSSSEELRFQSARRVAALFFGWIVLLVLGSLVTAALSDHGALESASGMFSALGNIGPCYISVEQMIALHPVVKVTYIVGMLAGRLEIVPVLMLLTRRLWR